MCYEKSTNHKYTFMTNKKTIVTGCSWTDRRYTSRGFPEIDTSWKKWDEYLGDAYGWDIINIGQNGAGTDYMLDRALEVIYREGSNIERCVVALSEWGRSMIPNGIGVNPNIQLWADKTGPMKPNHQYALKFFEVYPFNERFQKQRINDNLYQIYRFIDICVDKNIEVVIFQMLDSIELFQEFCSRKEWVDLNRFMMDNEYFSRIEHVSESNSKVKIMGWPFVPDLGGTNIVSTLKQRMGEWGYAIHDLNKVPNGDGHPSGKGHKEIANIIMEWYNDLD